MVTRISRAEISLKWLAFWLLKLVVAERDGRGKVSASLVIFCQGQGARDHGR
jgi:hypothetical protein